MKIPVMLHYDTVQSIDARDLRRLLATGTVLAFKRADRWVKIGSEPLRGEGGADYDGPERRNIIQKPLTDDARRAGLHCILGTTGPDPSWK